MTLYFVGARSVGAGLEFARCGVVLGSAHVQWRSPARMSRVNPLQNVYLASNYVCIVGKIQRTAMRTDFRSRPLRSRVEI